MIEPRDVKVFTGTMDQDTEARYLKEGNYRYLLNARNAIGTQGSFGAIEDVMGNSLVTNPNLPLGTNKVIGSYEDIAGQSCIYFVYNSNGYHGIYRWYANRVGFPNGVIEKIYQVADPAAYNQYNPNPLNFQENNLITGVALVEDILYWTDGFNEPKAVNIVRANNTNKKFAFNLYLNNLSFNVNTTYNLNINLNAVLQTTITWTSLSSVSNTLKQRLIDAETALSASPLISVVNKEFFLEITVNNVGDYSIFISDNSSNQSDVYPENFYPDFPSYPALNNQLFTRVKYPPFCSLESSFVNDYSVLGVFTPNFTLGNGQWSNASLAPPTGYYNYPGNQQLNFTLTLTFSVAGFTSGFSNLNIIMSPSLFYTHIAGNGTFTYTWSWTYNEVFATPQLTWDITPTQCSVQIISGQYSATNNANALLWDVGINNSPIISSFGIPVDYYPGFNLLRGNSSINNTAYTLLETTPLFRVKYIYVDQQHSVYSSISAITLPTDYVNNQLIKLDFSDKRLSNVYTACDINKIIIAQSIDDGTTWWDIIELDRYEWVGQNKQVYYYTGNDTNITVDPAEALLQYHAVPLKSKSLEYIGERIFDGQITEGYDKIRINAEVSVKYIPLTDPSIISQRTFIPYVSTAYWKRGYSGRLGIVYYDDADRKCGVCTWIDNAINIPTYNASQPQPFAPAYLELAIYNEPPSWATKYQIVRTKDTVQVKYLIFNTNTYRYVDKYGNVTLNPNLIKYLILDVSQVFWYSTVSNIGAQIDFTYVAGDRIKFICDQAGTLFNENDAQVVQVIGNEIYVLAEDLPQIFVQAVNQTLVFEIYTPNNKDNIKYESYYEFGECYEIGQQFTVANGWQKFHFGNLLDQDLATGTPALLQINHGNVYYRNFDLYYNLTQPAPPNIPALAQLYLNSQQPYEQNALLFYGNGRVNSPYVEDQKEINSIRFTDINNANRNNLNVNQPLNIEDYNSVYGPINKLQVVNNDILKLIFGNSYQLSVYVSQGVIRQTQGNVNLVSISDQVAGNSHIIQRTLGTINAESVIVNDEADMFGYDENEGVVWVASGNGLIQISDRGMKSIFKRYSNERKASGLPSETPAVYDLYHDEYIITFGTITDPNNPANSFAGVTIAYNKQKSGWTSYYSFVPEYYGRVRDYVVSFKDGDLWVHDRNQLSKNFYGTQYTRQLTYISNKDFPKVKDYKAVSVNGIGANSAPTIRILPFQGYLSGMLSSLSTRFFQTLEGVQYAYFQKDKLSPGFGGNQLQALANGRNLKGQVIEVTLENTDTAKSIIYSSDIIYFYSEHS